MNTDLEISRASGPATVATVVALFTSAVRRAPMQPVQEFQLIPGLGIEGDRYAKHAGTFSKRLAPDREVTLIESEAIEAARAEFGVELDPGESRRNVVTRGVRLNELVDREFSVGSVRLRGIKLCHPCTHLQGLTGKDVLRALKDRGGLRAQVLNEGAVRVGDPVTAAGEAPPA